MAGAVILGMLPLLLLPQLPTPIICWLLAGVVAVLWWLPHRLCRLLALAICSLLWGSWQGSALLRQIEDLGERPLQVIARINTLDLRQDESQRVQFQLLQADGRWVFPPLTFSAYLDPLEQPFCAGQRWQLTVRLQPVHSQLNQGGFDRQRWALANRQPFSGRINQLQVLDGRCGLRQRIVTRTDHYLAATSHRALLIALAFGETRLLEPAQRALFLQTGTAHLIAISGLHIGMSALFGWGVMRLLQLLLPSAAIGYRLPLLFSWLVALCYVWLAGGNPPALRAGLALTLWILLRLRGIHCHSWQVLLWVMAIILLSEPLAVLSNSFWLSCLAVASLIFWFIWVPLPARFSHDWRWGPLRWLHLQMGMMLLLLPLQIALFQGTSLTSLPANLWAVPVMTFTTVPLLLLGLASSTLPALSRLLWQWADRSLVLVQLPLESLQGGWLVLDHAALPAGMLGWLAIIVWRFHWWRYYRIALLTLLIWLLQRGRGGDSLWRVDMLDVGHGLAMVIERDGQALLYDTGNIWEGGSVAQSVILPHLRWRGLTPQQVILSHSHSDHNGGIADLIAAFPQVQLRSPYVAPGYLPCRQGERWQWQGLDFEVLWPPALVAYAGNEHSCTIRVSDGRWSLLLTGDLPAAEERWLVREQREKLATTVLQVPHHGSRTSSTFAFINAVQPELAISSAARYGRWRLPAPTIVRRYQINQIPWRDTARSGQLSLLFFEQNWQINGLREQLMPRWYHQWFGVMKDNG